jgi:hypothetical protein
MQARARLERIRSGGSSELDAAVAFANPLAVTPSCRSFRSLGSADAGSPTAAAFLTPAARPDSPPQQTAALPTDGTAVHEGQQQSELPVVTHDEPRTPPRQIMHRSSAGAAESPAAPSPAGASSAPGSPPAGASPPPDPAPPAAGPATSDGAVVNRRGTPAPRAAGDMSSPADGAEGGHLHAAAAKPAADGVTVNMRESSKSVYEHRPLPTHVALVQIPCNCTVTVVGSILRPDAAGTMPAAC